MRRDIDRHPRRIKDVLLEDGVRKEFLGGVHKNDAKAVKAFVSNNAANALKTKPKVRLCCCCENFSLKIVACLPS